MRIDLPQDLGVGYTPKRYFILPKWHLLSHVLHCFIHNIQKLEITKIPLNRRMAKANAVHWIITQHIKNGVMKFAEKCMEARKKLPWVMKLTHRKKYNLYLLICGYLLLSNYQAASHRVVKYKKKRLEGDTWISLEGINRIEFMGGLWVVE